MDTAARRPRKTHLAALHVETSSDNSTATTLRKCRAASSRRVQPRSTRDPRDEIMTRRGNRPHEGEKQGGEEKCSPLRATP